MIYIQNACQFFVKRNLYNSFTYLVINKRYILYHFSRRLTIICVKV